MVGEVADDVADVEARGEVGGDAAQRLAAAEAARRLLGRARAADEDAERPGDRAGEPRAVVGPELHRAREDEDAPWLLAAGDAHDELVGAHAEDRRRAGRAGPGVDRLR